MSLDSTSNLDGQQHVDLSGFELPPDFSMPALAEIEQILALGDRSWTSLLGIGQPSPELMPARRHAPARSRRARAGKSLKSAARA
jgi:hypothetical protein